MSRMTSSVPVAEWSVFATVSSSEQQAEVGRCSGRWGAPNHLLFQLAHAAMMVAYLSPSTVHGIVMLNATLVLAFLMMSGWAWAVICAPDVFSWNFSFMVINLVQMLCVLYRVRPVRFSPELEDVYKVIFEPLQVPRETFKKLVAGDMCSVHSLQPGDSYAKQGVTKTDRLGLVITGSVCVLNQGQVLHRVSEKQFLDSPEFESTGHYDERFHVSIMAETPCRYLCWKRHSLGYLFAQEPYLATVMGTVIGRDVTNKLYALNEKVRIARGARIDIRLPSVSSTIRSSSQLSDSMSDYCDKDLTMIATTTADSTYDLGDDVADDGAYCALLQHDVTRHHSYTTAPFHQCDVTEEQLVTCALL